MQKLKVKTSTQECNNYQYRYCSLSDCVIQYVYNVLRKRYILYIFRRKYDDIVYHNYEKSTFKGNFVPLKQKYLFGEFETASY